MGLTYARSVKFGALRFNFSSSGIGVSAGIPGFRVGTGPRGAYVSAGAGGFRYRQSLGASKRSTVAPARVQSPPQNVPQPDAFVPPAGNVVGTVQHTSANVLSLSDTSGDELLASLNEQAKRSPIWPFVAAAACLAFIFLQANFSDLPPAVTVGAIAFGLLCTLWVRHIDQLRRLTVLFYDADAAFTSKFTDVIGAASAIAAIGKLRAVLSTSQYRDSKYTAGAGQGLQMAGVSVSVGQVPGIAANLDVPILKAGKLTLALFPDRLLVFEGRDVAGIDYGTLSAAASNTRFVEKEGVPRDAQVVDRTWQYVNKSGGPDRRFKDNHQYPVCLHQEFHMGSPRGLDFRLIGSHPNAFGPLVLALNAFQALPTVKPRAAAQQVP